MKRGKEDSMTAEARVEQLRNKTCDIIGSLSERQVQEVFSFVKKLFEDENLFKLLTKEQILADLDASEEDIKSGRIKDSHKAMDDIRSRLGMPGKI